jgi:predicted GIY-YIG superfamily endonuclease
MPKTARKIPVVSVKSSHRIDCKKRGQNTYTRCSCPKQLVWSKDGEEHRESAETCDYEVAEKRAREKMAMFETRRTIEMLQGLCFRACFLLNFDWLSG